MKSVREIESELQQLIVDTLLLEEVTPAEIAVEDPLFGEGLGLDSIDALELSMAIAKRYEIEMGSDQDQNRNIYRSVSTLAAYIQGELTRESQS